ncbi:MAG: SAM-dependent methyltransferase [Alphaproteobacteria bacterium]|nr:SAM-dependent methyltransferase [Alphaproteobacteria bacterium]
MPSPAPNVFVTPGDLRLRALLQENGAPLSVADFMAFALQDPEIGYYQKRLPLGSHGDFITAPEISPLFGEIVGGHLIHRWQEQGRPHPFSLVELGPGRGTLMADILRVASKVDPAFFKGAQVHLIERHPHLRRLQKDGIKHPHVTWHDDLETALKEPYPLFLIANEFFDALPIHQYEKHDTEWHERGITLTREGALSWTLMPTVESFDVKGAFFESAPLGHKILSQILMHLECHTGSAFICDYGYETGYVDTLQGVKDHRYHDVLSCVGEVDLSAHVDFGAFLRQAKKHTLATRLMTQGDFLKENFLEARIEALMKAPLSLSQKRALQEGALRLTEATEMGVLFKVLVLDANGRHL